MIKAIKSFLRKNFMSDAVSGGIARRVSVSPFGSYSTGRGGGSKWPHGLSSSGSSPCFDHTLLRQNARSAYHDTPAAKALVDRFADTVIDCGLRLEAAPKFELLGITPEQAEHWSATVNEQFDNWASDKKSLRDETMTFYQAQRLVEIFQQRDNDYFVRLYYSSRRDLLNPLQISFLDPNQIRGNAYTSTYGFQQDNDGIVRNEMGRESAYKVWIKQKDGQYKESQIDAFGKRSKRPLMLHGFQPEYAGQGRGYSRLSHLLQEFENLTDFSVSQIKKAIAQSSITMFNKPSRDNAASNPLEAIEHGMAGPLGAPPTKEEAEQVGLDLDEYVKYVPIPEATFTRPGSVGVFNLQGGEELVPLKHTSPSESYPEFVNSFVSYLSASNSMPIEVLLMKFEQNYSASRGALILFWRIAQIWRAEIAADFLDPVYYAWLAGEIAAGRILCPGWQDPRLRACWLGHNWIGAPMPNIDPAKTAKADKEYAELGAQTLDRIAINHNGSSGKSNRAKLAREFAELPKAPWAEGNTTVVKSDNEDDEKEDE